MKKVSIVVPMYNIENQISKCLDTLINQTYKDVEIIVVDDGSTDNGVNIVEKIVQNSKNISLLKQKNAGASSARNNGTKHASGDYIAYIDGDDWIDIDFVEKMVDKMEENALDFVVCDYIISPYISTENEERITFNLDESKIYTKLDIKTLVNEIGNAPWNKLYKKSIIDENKLEFPVGYRHHDMAFVQSYLVKCNRIGYVNEPLNYYLKDRPNNISTSYDNKLNNIINMLEYVIEVYRQENLFELCYNELCFLSLSNLVISLKKLVHFTSSKFIVGYINEVYDFLDRNFKGFKNNCYFDTITGNDRIYKNRNLVKAYYLVKTSL